MKTSINILFFFLLISCSSPSLQKGLVYEDFPQTQELKAKEIQLDIAVFRYPFRIRIQDDIAVILDLHGTDHFFQVFRYPQFSYIASFGKRGDSPDDMLSAENVRWNRRD